MSWADETLCYSILTRHLVVLIFVLVVFFFFPCIPSLLSFRSDTDNNLLKRKRMETELSGFRKIDEAVRNRDLLCDAE